MILLDTNVVSELMKPVPARPVADWVALHAATSLYTTSITEAEILHGVMLLPAGQRRARLQAAAEAMLDEDFRGRVLPFGCDASRVYALIAAQRRRSGRPISHFDAQIAAIGRWTRAALATRNTTDFEGWASSWSIPGGTERRRLPVTAPRRGARAGPASRPRTRSAGAGWRAAS